MPARGAMSGHLNGPLRCAIATVEMIEDGHHPLQCERTDDVTAKWTLNHQFVAVHEVSRERDTNGRPEYQATAYVGWHGVKKHYVCYWLDAFGGGLVGTGFAEPRPNELSFVFGEAGEAFHNTFV